MNKRMNRRKLIRDRLDKVIERVADKAAHSDQADLEQSLKVIDGYSKLLGVIPARRKYVNMTIVVIAAFCILFIISLCYLKNWSNAVQLDVRSKDVALRLRERWILTESVPLQTGLVRIEGVGSFQNLFIKELNLESPDNQAWMHIKADTVELMKLEIDSGACINITKGEGKAFSLRAETTQISGMTQFSGKTLIWWGKDRFDQNFAEYNFQYPETIDFRIADSSRSEVRFEAMVDESWITSGLCVDSLIFTDQTGDSRGEGQFESSIIGGTIQLPEVASEKRLYKREPLGLTKVIGRAEIRLDDSLKVAFAGKVAKINVELKGTRRNLAPPLLEYIYYNWRMTFILSIISSLWAILYGVRRILFRQ